MTLRLFVVVGILLIGLIFNGVLIGLEHTPSIVTEEEIVSEEDRFKDMVWAAGNRRANLAELNVPEDQVDKVVARIAAMAKRDRKGDLLKALKENSDDGGRLCSNFGVLPSRYFAMGMLISGERGTRRTVIPFNQIRNKVAMQESFRQTDMEDMYNMTERVPGAAADAYPLNVVALLFGEDVERLSGEDDWGDGVLFGGPDIRSMLTKRGEVELDFIEFFAAMHYMHEVARDPQNEFCGVRAGVEFGEQDE